MTGLFNRHLHNMLQCTILNTGEKKELEMKQNLITRLFASPASRQDRELAYLNQSVTIYDLERRQREVSNGLFRVK
jgi:hypothetical protein